jgi:transposase InsO family protein
MNMPPSAKYKIIEEMTSRDNNLLNISTLCDAAGVSRSGYYNYLATEETRKKREEKDRNDFALILEAYHFRGYSKGARSIYMRLLHMDPPIVMNLKKIRRLMKKYSLHCPKRGANPYRRMAKALRTNHIAENILNREFKGYAPRQALLTDITYLFYKGGVGYLSPIIDVCTHEVLAHTMSENLKVDFVIEMVDNMCEKYGAELDDTTLIHSDQGFHYTSRAFVQKLRDKNYVQSMSRRGNCWDNAPQESFFGHMKDDLAKAIAQCETFVEVTELVNDWIDYYNNDRYQWDLEMLSPREYYKYLITGIYPLQKGISKGCDTSGIQ